MKTSFIIVLVAMFFIGSAPTTSPKVIYGHDMSYSTDENGNQIYTFKGGNAGKEDEACSTAKEWKLPFDQYDHFDTDKSPCGDQPSDAVLKFVRKK